MTIGGAESAIADIIDQFVEDQFGGKPTEWKDAAADDIYAETAAGFHSALQKLEAWRS